MAEPIVIELNKDTDFDGVSPIALTRDDFTVSGQRYYKASVPGPGGLIAGDLFGLFQGASPKLVGLASSSFNPQSVARVISSDATGTMREEIDLNPYVQHVLVFPGDKLAIRTMEGARVQVVLVVNELNEGENIQYYAGASSEPRSEFGADGKLIAAGTAIADGCMAARGAEGSIGVVGLAAASAALSASVTSRVGAAPGSAVCPSPQLRASSAAAALIRRSASWILRAASTVCPSMSCRLAAS